MPFTTTFSHKEDVIKNTFNKIKPHHKKILFPESDDKRILEAAGYLAKRKILTPVLLGDKTKILRKLKNMGFSGNNIEYVSVDSKKKEQYVQQLLQIRKHKKITKKAAQELLDKHPMYYATMLLYNGTVDGIVAGATYTSRETFLPALQIIKTKRGIRTASSYFIMLLEDRVLFYSDCGLNIDPSAEQLADIALSTAKTAKSMGFTPKVAMLSFSTKGSAHHPKVDKVAQATKMVKRKAPKLVVDGEMQLDAALVPSVAKAKAPKSKIKGNANVLIFPDLNAGNIGYKITQRLAHALAIGPVTQGLKKPVNDLSRGCSTKDIIEVAALTALQALE